jgi:hypothetical protein
MDEQFAWPEGCQAAISLTFDDGLRSQLEIAIPRLEERGLRGTFYLNPRGEDWLEMTRTQVSCGADRSISARECLQKGMPSRWDVRSCGRISVVHHCRPALCMVNLWRDQNQCQ